MRQEINLIDSVKGLPTIDKTHISIWGKLKTLLALSLFSRTIWGVLSYYNVPGPWIEPAMVHLAKYVGEGDTVIDIGANVGIYTLKMSRVVARTGLVISFEPNPMIARQLRQLLKILRIDNVIVEQIAISDETGCAGISIPLDDIGLEDNALAHIASLQEHSTFEVRTETLDHWLHVHSIGRISFIKCDAEGAEFSILRGALSTILKDRPYIVMEIDDEWPKRYGHTREEVLSILVDAYHYLPFGIQRNTLVPVNDDRYRWDNYLLKPA